MQKEGLSYLNYLAIIEEIGLYTQAVGYRPNTAKSIVHGVKAFLIWLENEGIYQLKDVKRKTIKAYHEHLKNRPNQLFEGGLSNKMIRDYLWKVSLLFKHQEQKNKLAFNPMSGYPLPKSQSKKRAILSLVEIEGLYQHCKSQKERIVLHLYYGLGLRRSEGEALNIDDVDFKNGWLFVRKGKGGKGRNMPLTNRIKMDLKSYILTERASVNHSALLLNRLKNRLRGQSALRILKTLLERAQITKKIDLHCLRHSIATHLINKGMPLEQLRDFLGHSHLESTQQYIHYDSKRVFTSTLQRSERQGL